MRVAIYARVSSERQEKEHTIGSQLEALRNYAAQNGMEIVEEFTDEGYSGARLDRPALDRMRDLSGAQRIRSAADLLYRSTGAEVCAAGPHSGGDGTIRSEDDFPGGRCGRRSALEAHAPNHRSRS